jgi:hypothetical protein
VSRALFVWYRVADVHEAEVVSAVRELQAQCAARWPGLACELWRREERAREVTLMESYRAPEGVSAAVHQCIEREAASRLAGRLIGARHAEAFEPCA